MRLQHLSCGGASMPVLAPLAALTGLQRLHCRGATRENVATLSALVAQGLEIIRLTNF